jgi:hypothetical protein
LPDLIPLTSQKIKIHRIQGASTEYRDPAMPFADRTHLPKSANISTYAAAISRADARLFGVQATFNFLHQTKDAHASRSTH